MLPSPKLPPRSDALRLCSCQTRRFMRSSAIVCQVYGRSLTMPTSSGFAHEKLRSARARIKLGGRDGGCDIEVERLVVYRESVVVNAARGIFAVSQFSTVGSTRSLRSDSAPSLPVLN